MQAFITGSRAYGKVLPKSDIDLVIVCSEETKQKLIKASASKKLPLRFGKLNIICCETELEAAAWLVATEKLKRKKVQSKSLVSHKLACFEIENTKSDVGISINHKESGE